MVKKINSHGFTLIEMLVAIALIGIIGSAANTIFFTTLRGVSKADTMRELKQNGEYASSNMEQMIRSALGVSDISGNCSGNGGCSGTMTASCIRILSPDNNTTIFSLSGGKIASNGAVLTNGLKTSVSNLTFTCRKPANAPAVITFSFDMAQAGNPVRAEEKASMSFKTTVSLRSY